MTLQQLRSRWAPAIEQLKSTAASTRADNYSGHNVVIHNASWCPDCEREVVELLALNELAGSGFDQITLHSYEDKAQYQARKQSGKLTVNCLPTIIIYRDETEVIKIEEDSKGELAGRLNNL